MDANSAKLTTVTEAITQIVAILENLPSEDQKRIISAVGIVLSHAPSTGPADVHVDTKSADGISTKAAQWMQKYSITVDQLSQVFSISPDEVDVIAPMLPSDSKRQQTLEAYVLCGLRSLIRTGDGRFEDKEARLLCEKLGCYDSANHSNYMKAFGNAVAGAKESGWKLTNPGLERAAQIVKKLIDHPSS
jgi:hypothetical protein